MPDLDPNTDPTVEDPQGGVEPTNPADDPVDDPEQPDDGPKTSNGKPWALSEDGKTNLGYPADTSASDMSLDEQVAWWKHKSRKWEGVAKKAKTPEEIAQLEQQLADLKSKTQSADEKALEQAIEQARKEGAESARSEFYPILHDTQIRGYATPYFAGDENPDALNTWIDGLAVEKFVDSESKMIDGAKLTAFLEASGRRIKSAEDDGTGPSAPQFPRAGQGVPPRKPKVNHAELGRQAAARRKTEAPSYPISQGN